MYIRFLKFSVKDFSKTILSINFSWTVKPFKLSNPHSGCRKLDIYLLQFLYHVTSDVKFLLMIFILFNRDLNRSCLVFIFSCVFQEVNFWWIHGNFVYVKLFRVRKIFRKQVFADLQFFHFAYSLTDMTAKIMIKTNFIIKNNRR